eukprot:1150866-Pelagomonas_calceolata.AAC.5
MDCWMHTAEDFVNDAFLFTSYGAVVKARASAITAFNIMQLERCLPQRAVQERKWTAVDLAPAQVTDVSPGLEAQAAQKLTYRYLPCQPTLSVGAPWNNLCNPDAWLGAVQGLIFLNSSKATLEKLTQAAHPDSPLSGGEPIEQWLTLINISIVLWTNIYQ